MVVLSVSDTQVFFSYLACFDGTLTNRRYRHLWSFSEECFQQLVESWQRGIKAALKAKGGQILLLTFTIFPIGGRYFSSVRFLFLLAENTLM